MISSSSDSENPLEVTHPILPSPSTFPKLCCMIPTQDTQLIDSPGSPRALHLPPRVSRRFYAPDNCYLVTPVSPESPTPKRHLKTLGSANLFPQLGAAESPLRPTICAQDNAAHLEEEEHVVHLSARAKLAFVPVPVPVIEPLQIFRSSPTVIERHQVGGRPIMTTPDLRCAARFDVENNDFDVFSNFRMRPEADIVQLNALDSKLATGLEPKEFWALFSKCARCNLFVTSRSMEYHKANQCEYDGFLSSIGEVSPISNEWFLPLLDSTWHDPHVTRIAGVPPNVFEQLFAVCRSCNAHMTARVSRNHRCLEPSPKAARSKEF